MANATGLQTSSAHVDGGDDRVRESLALQFKACKRVVGVGDPDFCSLGSARHVTCTIVVASGSPDLRPITYNSEPMPLLESFMVDRIGVCALRIESLVYAMRESIPLSAAPVPAAVQNVLSAQTAVDVATMRVPFFSGRDWQSTEYGFRMLPSCIPASAEMVVPSGSHDNVSLVFAIDLEHPKTVDFLRMWQVTGIQPETHFICIFFPPLTLAALGPPAQRQSCLPRSEGSAGGADVPPMDFGQQLTPSTSFDEACTILGVSRDEVEKGRYRADTAHKALLFMVQNWAASTHILAKFCVSQSPEHTFPGGYVARRTSILTSLGWGEISFSKKTKWYTWASQAACRSWKQDPVAGISHPLQSTFIFSFILDSDSALYGKWRGICFLWKQGGPLITGKLPLESSGDRDERATAGLIQRDLEASRVAIEARLAPMPSS
ncbi:hypothetical protein FB45DRAFT_859141 [Roridomyces roridus]|uniref:Uncharacterized protein n=1 Tax=Roridomyces roridus TaxID=1738132 RepID=A0AAD7CJ59_9AGAR|nr:hypothetical protein FB45DRAFT_859141 [Roridomyces roridus]